MLPFGEHLQQELPQLNLAIVPGTISLVRRLDSVAGNDSDRFDGRLFHQHRSAADNRPIRFHRLHVLVVTVVIADVTRNGSHLQATQQLDMRKEHIIGIDRNPLVEFWLRSDLC